MTRLRACLRRSDLIGLLAPRIAGLLDRPSAGAHTASWPSPTTS